MSLVIATAPAAEPVTLSEAKAHCRVDTSADDTLITALIVAARETVETITRRALMAQTWDLYLDKWPDCGYIKLPLPPLQSVTSISYKDSSGASTTWTASNYIVTTSYTPGRIVLADGISFPSVTLYPVDAIKVRFVAGYASAGVIPQAIKQAILMLIGHYYENREAAIVAAGMSVAMLPMGVEALLATHRVVEF